MDDSSIVNKRVLVVGGTGQVGEGIVRQLLLAGASVVVPARSQATLDALSEALGGKSARLDMFVGQFSRLEQAQVMRDRALSRGALDAVVVSIGGWWAGHSLDHVDQNEWDKVIASNLTPHFAVAAALIPVLKQKPSSTFVQIIGGAAEHAAPGSSLTSISAAAVAMMGEALKAESADGPPTILQLQIDAPVLTRSQPNATSPAVHADDVGEVVVKLIEGRTRPDDGLRLHIKAKPEGGAVGEVGA